MEKNRRRGEVNNDNKMLFDPDVEDSNDNNMFWDPNYKVSANVV